MSWTRRHALVLAAAIGAVVWFVIYTWSEWRFFIDNSFQHGSAPQGFWSSQHLHDWLYNLSANVVSEVMFGVFFVIMFHKVEGSQGADKEDT